MREPESARLRAGPHDDRRLLSDLALLWRLFAGRRRVLALGVAAAVAQAGVLVPIGFLVRHVFEHGIPRDDTASIVLDGAAILGLYGAAAVLSLVSGRLVLGATIESTGRLRDRVLERLHELPIAWFERPEAHEVRSTVVAHAERAEAVAYPVATLAQAVVVGPPLAALAAIISPGLALLLLVAVPVPVAVALVTRRRVLLAVRAWHAEFSRFGGHVALDLRTMALTRSRSADDRELERGRALVAELGAAFGRKSTAQHAAGVAQGAVAAVVGGLILIAGSVSVAGGNLGLADLLAFYAVIGLLLRTVAGSGGVSGQLVAGAESLRALYAVVDDPTPGPYALGGPTPVALCPLELRSVTFGYGDTGDAPVLRELDLVLEPGERVALIGPNGAGKSTIAGLLLGLRRPWSGTALAAGVPYDDLDVEVLRRRIGHVAQDVSLRPGTVRENVAFGRDPGVGDVERAAALAGVSDLLEVEVVDGGAPLSGGERQRVALARALVGGPEVLVLDEPGNHLDVAALERLTSALDLLEPPPAVLLITHQPTLAQWAGRTVSVGEAVGACRTDDTGIAR